MTQTGPSRWYLRAARRLVKRIQAGGAPGALASLCRASAALSLLTAFQPFGLYPGILLVDVVPLAVVVSARVLAVNVALLLLALARQLRLGKRRAWKAAVALTTLGLAAVVVKGPDLPAVAAKTSFLVLLVAYRSRFTAAADPPSIRQAVRFVPVYSLGVLAYVTAAFALSRFAVAGHVDLTAIARTAGYGLMGQPGPLRFENALVDRIFYGTLAVAGSVGAATTAYLVFRPVVEGVACRGRPRDAARAIVRRWGSDPLSYFALREDKSYFFSDCGRAFLAYRYVNGVACVSGDPIGDPERIRPLLESFVDLARSHGWRVAILAGRLENEPLYSALGMKSYYLGDEALIDLEAFSLEGRPIRKVRQSCSRLRRLGFDFELKGALELPASVWEEMEAVRKQWRGKAPNRGFSMATNRRYGPGDDDCLVALSRGPDGRLYGYLKLVPFYGDKPGYSLDEMSRLPDSPNGLMEFMVARTCLQLRDRGLKYLSLNFAAFSRLISGTHELGPRERLERLVVKALNPYFQIESLYRFNKKFFPLWVPRALYYDEGVNLARVALSYLELEAFLRLGWIRRWLLPPLELRR